MKSIIAFLLVSMTALSGCSVAAVGSEGEDADETASPEAVGAVAQASTLGGVQQIPSCSAGTGGPAGWPGVINNWYAIYGSFDNDGANVTANVACTFSNGDPPIALSYVGSNYRSSSQVNLQFAASTRACPAKCAGKIYDAGVLLGSF